MANHKIDKDGMVDFRLSIDQQRWQQFTEACNANAGRELSPAEVETRAFDIWTGSIDAIVEHYKVKENNGPVVLTEKGFRRKPPDFNPSG
jgi:hypothetical protein